MMMFTKFIKREKSKEKYMIMQTEKKDLPKGSTIASLIDINDWHTKILDVIENIRLKTLENNYGKPGFGSVRAAADIIMKITDVECLDDDGEESKAEV